MYASIVSRLAVQRNVDLILLITSIVLVLLFVGFAVTIDAIGFPLDDSWIHQTYARNLGAEGEWAFVPGEASAASTAPLYSALLAIGHVFGLSPYLWAHTLGAIALFGGGAVAARLAQQLFPNVPFVGLATGLLIIGSWHMIWAAASGMETMQFMTLGLAVIWLTWRELDETTQQTTRDLMQRGTWVGVVGALLTLTRPEGVGLVGLAGLTMLLSNIHGSRTDYVRWAAGVVLGFALVMVPYAIINFAITERILPTTASAKIAQNAPLRDDSIISRYLRMLLPVTAGAQLLWLPGVVAGVGVLWRRHKLSTRWLYFLPVIWAFAHLTLFVFRLPAPYQHGRYVMPIIPPILLYAPGGMFIMAEVAKNQMVPRVLTRTLALSAILAVPGFMVLGGQAYGRDVRIINTEMVQTAKWVADNVPPEELLAVHDIGAVGYYAPRDVLDLAGLVSPEVVPIIRDPEALMELICERNAQWLMVLPEQRPAEEDDPRLELAYETGEPYILDLGGEGNMTVYRLHYNEDCEAP